jgi:eukaryotic-like serine/threonine-protein kinase
MTISKFILSREFVKQLIYIIIVFIVVTIITLLMLRYYTQHGKSIAVPDLSGCTEEMVHEKLRQKHLRFQIVDSVYMREAVPGSVIDQHPKPGYRVKGHRKIFITLAAVAPENVLVPFIADISFREATNKLQLAGLTLGSVEYRPSQFPNLVLDQLYLGNKIFRDTLLPKGSAIDLVVGRGGGLERTEVPDLFGLSITEARRSLIALNLDMGVLIYDDSFLGNEDTLGARVYMQSPRHVPGQMVGQGTLVDIRVSKYEELFMQENQEMEEDADSTGGI